MMSIKQAYIEFSDPHKFRDELLLQTGKGVVRFGNVMAPFQKRDFENLDSGFCALAGGKVPIVRRYWLERTKGGSKDSDAAVMLLWIMTYAQRALRIQIGAYDASQADEIRLIIKQLLKLEGPVNRLLRDRITVYSDRFMCEKTGVEAEILTTDSLGSHGSRPDVVILNELSHVRDSEFARTVLDNADKVASSIVLICTNAGTIDSWQHAWREVAIKSRRWYFSALSEPAPWISEEDLAEARLRNPPARMDRLWAGRWVRGTGDALDLQVIEQSIVRDGPEMQARPNCLYVGGLDVGIRRDHTAFVVVGYDQVKERFYLADCMSWAPTKGNEVDVQAVENAILQAHSRFHFRLVGYDPHQAVHVAQRLNRRGVRMEEVVFAGSRLGQLASCLIESFNSRVIDLYNEPALVKDLGRLSIEERPYGYRLTSVSDAYGHADRATGLMIALMLIRDLVRNVSHHRSTGIVARRVEPAVDNARRHGVLLQNTGRAPWDAWGRN